jgi:hypothetical protein
MHAYFALITQTPSSIKDQGTAHGVVYKANSWPKAAERTHIAKGGGFKTRRHKAKHNRVLNQYAHKEGGMRSCTQLRLHLSKINGEPHKPRPVNNPDRPYGNGLWGQPYETITTSRNIPPKRCSRLVT